MTDGPTTDELRLVAQHGSGDIQRMLAIVELARRRDRLEELREFVED
ncbi:hypothetical protein [Halostagnicola sp. A56]|nr:hypothetical protein [Halostagnicola sp. A56]